MIYTNINKVGTRPSRKNIMLSCVSDIINYIIILYTYIYRPSRCWSAVAVVFSSPRQSFGLLLLDNMDHSGDVNKFGQTLWLEIIYSFNIMFWYHVVSKISDLWWNIVTTHYIIGKPTTIIIITIKRPCPLRRVSYTMLLLLCYLLSLSLYFSRRSFIPLAQCRYTYIIQYNLVFYAGDYGEVLRLVLCRRRELRTTHFMNPRRSLK